MSAAPAESALVGVIGHVDHGKTTLVKALTGINTDRLKEEKRRGLSIALGFSFLEVGGWEIDLVDMPGHERFLPTMISGATGMTALLLVVAANEGVRPQTIEHLEIARLLGLRRGVLALTKCDLASAEERRSVAQSVRALCREKGFQPLPVVETAAWVGTGIETLSQRLADLAAPERAQGEDVFYLPVDRRFSIPGFGPVVTGTLRRGSLSLGQRVEIQPEGIQADVRSLQSHGRFLERVAPGRRTAVNLRGVDLAALRCGQALTSPGLLGRSHWIDAQISLSPETPRGLRNGDALRLLFGTCEVAARLRLLDCDELAPGREVFAQLATSEAIAIPARESFILRGFSPAITLGGGRVLNPLSRRQRRKDPKVLERFAVLAEGEASRILEHHLANAGLRGCAAEDLARSYSLSIERLGREAARCGARRIKGARLVHPQAWRVFSRSLLETLARYHSENPMEAGLSREELIRRTLGGTRDAHVAEAVLDWIQRRGWIVTEGPLLRRADFQPAEGLGRAERKLLAEMEARFREGGLTPPDLQPLLAGRPGYKAALGFLIRSGRLVETRDRVQRRVIVFHREAVEQASEMLSRAPWPAGGFSVSQAGRLLAISRKYSIPLLEHLDAQGVTKRSGDLRVLCVRKETAAE